MARPERLSLPVPGGILKPMADKASNWTLQAPGSLIEPDLAPGVRPTREDAASEASRTAGDSARAVAQQQMAHVGVGLAVEGFGVSATLLACHGQRSGFGLHTGAR